MAEDRFSALSSLVDLVHALGSEISVTLLVSGRVVTGLITPNQRFAAWMKEVTVRAAREGGTSRLPVDVTFPPTPEEQERMRAEFEQSEQERKEAEAADGRSRAAEYPHLCLRNATIHAPIPMNSETYTYLLVRLAAVDAFTLGTKDEVRLAPAGDSPAPKGSVDG